MVPRAGMIKRPAGEGRFALHASKVRIARLDEGVAADKRDRQACNAPLGAMTPP
jgi:hypothetical protein